MIVRDALLQRRITEQLVLFEVESTHRLGLASAEEDGRHFARATRALAFFNGLLDDRQRRGCMLVNTALEVAPHDPEFRGIVVIVLGEIEAFFCRCIQAGQQDGTISTSQSATDLARMLLGVHVGLRVIARTRPERELLEGMVRPALALLNHRQSEP
ncbi:TetR family transcriptional regulator C-terminal domain-containing protein [Stutzerimonas chloritidismutans]|uniref:TetR family transcriptional regulator C-terminal domain-containing protein n=1 Tax=Stutzerimonas chloritidismutans TaxID=203192 RepID=UPI003CC90D66